LLIVGLMVLVRDLLLWFDLARWVPMNFAEVVRLVVISAHAWNDRWPVAMYGCAPCSLFSAARCLVSAAVGGCGGLGIRPF